MMRRWSESESEVVVAWNAQPVVRWLHRVARRTEWTFLGGCFFALIVGVFMVRGYWTSSSDLILD
jgi:hypothetical protein